LTAQTLATTPHSLLHGNLGDAIRALEAKVGVNNSPDQTSLDYLIRHIDSLPSQTGNAGKYLTTDGTVASWGAISTGLTVGTTPITGGTIGNVLYHAASNLLGEMTTSGTGTQLAATASPTFTGTVGAAAITASGVVSLSAGSVSAPGMIFATDTATGFGRLRANDIDFFAQGASLLRLQGESTFLVGLSGSMSINWLSTGGGFGSGAAAYGLGMLQEGGAGGGVLQINNGTAGVYAAIKAAAATFSGTLTGAAATFSGTVTATGGVITGKVYPASDSTTALQILKADGTTAVVKVDTTNSYVGIGMTPTNKLSVLGTAETLNQQASAGIGNSSTWLAITDTSGSTASAITGLGFGYRITSSGQHHPVIVGGRLVLTTGNTKGAFFIATRDVTTNTAPTERFTVDTTGYVGCNNTAPSAQHHVVSSAAGTIAGIDQGAASQTADLRQWLKSDGTVYSRVTAVGWIQNAPGLARVTADVTNATATMSNLSDLSITVVAGRKYFGKVCLFANDSVNVDGLAFDLGGGSATFTSIEFGLAAQPLGSTTGTVTSTAATTALTLTAVSTSDACYEITVGFVVNAAGTVIPRFAQNSHSTGTATVRLNSFLLVEDSPN